MRIHIRDKYSWLMNSNSIRIHCDPSDHLQESPGPPGPKSQKSLKKSLFGGPQKSPRKYPKKSKNTPKSPILGIFYFFRYFRGLFCGPPKRLFLRLFCDFGPGGPGDSCKWSLGSQRIHIHQETPGNSKIRNVFIPARMVLAGNFTSSFISSGIKRDKLNGTHRAAFADFFADFCRFSLFFLGIIIDLLMGLFRGAVFRHGGGALKQPIKQPTETPTSTLALMGRFPSLMGRFPTLMGRFTDFVVRGRFTS